MSQAGLLCRALLLLINAAATLHRGSASDHAQALWHLTTAAKLQSTAGTHLVLNLAGDEWKEDVASSAAGSARDLLLGSFESLQPHEPAGWSAAAAGVLSNRPRRAVNRTSTTTVRIELPQLPCYDILYPR